MQIIQILLSIFLLLCFFIEFLSVSIKSSYINKRKTENSRRCDVCNIDVHRASMQEHLGTEKHLDNENKME